MSKIWPPPAATVGMVYISTSQYITSRRVIVYTETVGRFGRIQDSISLKYDTYAIISPRSRGPISIPARESLERPLVCMPCWLSASVVTTALSLTVLFACFSLDSDMSSVRVDQYVCMGCQSWQSGHGATYLPTYKAAACQCCHYACSCACNQSNRCIWLVTIMIQSRHSDRDAGHCGAGASGP